MARRRMRRKSVTKWVVVVIAILLFIVLIVSGAVEINMLKLWDWLGSGAKSVTGVLKPGWRDIAWLVVGIVIGIIAKTAWSKRPRYTRTWDDEDEDDFEDLPPRRSSSKNP